MSVVGKPRSYFKKFLFTLEISQVAFAGFQKASELSMETAVIEQFEGGAITAEKSPGRVKVADVTLERGATKDLDLWQWAKQVSNIAQNGGVIDDQYKRSLDLVQRDRDGSELRRWSLYDAWPNKFVAGDWDNTADANVIESITLTFKYFVPDDDVAA